MDMFCELSKVVDFLAFRNALKETNFSRTGRAGYVSGGAWQATPDRKRNREYLRQIGI